MVNILMTIVLMAVLGALIGGITNFIAIKMLFRPYKAVYIGKWRLPFTPGLIPKRRDELSTQLGRTIVQHLLTPETFKKRFFNEEMRSKLEAWMYRELKTHVFESERSLNGWLEIAGQQNLDVRIESKLDELVDRQALALRAYIEGKTIGELLPENWKEETEQKMIHAVKYGIDQGSDYFASIEGRQTVKNFFDEFLESRGRFGHMLHSLLGESKPIVDRIQPEIIKFLNSPRTFELAITLAYGEWEKLQDRRADDLLKEFDFEPAVGAVKQYVREIANIDGRLDRTLAETWPTGLEWTSANIIPLVTDFVFEQGEVKLEDTLHKIDIQGMVKEQVDSLPLSRLEELVLGISQRELKMITALGFFLGGFIGIFQGIISIVLNNA
ncbi:membrane protein [Planococcus glaciei]|nr:membrane protein [Planococcus glaciei]